MRLLAIFACLAAGASFYAEHVWQYVPCTLCLIQRWLYIGLIPLTLMQGRLARWGTGLLLYGMICVAGYQTLIQMGVLKDRCKVIPAQVSEALLFTAGCAKAWKLYGVPIAAINGLFASGWILLLCSQAGNSSSKRSL
jgi:disulfide bond formation protein DsbB